MTGTKTLRYDTTVLDARALADALEAEEKAGWEVAEAAYDGTDFVVTFAAFTSSICFNSF